MKKSIQVISVLAVSMAIGLPWSHPVWADIKFKPLEKKPDASEALQRPQRSSTNLKPLVVLGLPDLPDEGPRYTTPVEGAGDVSFMEGLVAYKRRDFKAAELAFRTLIMKNPGSPLIEPAQVFLAEMLVGVKPTDQSRMQAIEAYHAILRDYPKSSNAARAQWRIGDLYAEMGLRVEAQATYQQGLTNFLTGADADRAMLGLSFNYVKWNKLREAAESFQQLRDHAVDLAMQQYGLFGVADTFYEKELYKDALEIYEEGYGRWPDFLKRRPQSFMNFIDTTLRLGKEQQGRRLGLTLFNLYPQADESPTLLVHIGDSYGRTGPRDKAGWLYSEAATRYPGTLGSDIARVRMVEYGAELMAEAKENSIQLLVQSKFKYGPPVELDGVEQRNTLYAIATEQAKLAVGSEAMFLLGKSFEMAKDLEQAVSSYRKVIARQGRVPDDPWPAAGALRLTEILEPWISKELEAQEAEHDLEAIEMFRQIGKLAEKSFTSSKAFSKVYLQIAHAHRRLGFINEAVQLYQNLVKNPATEHLKEEALVGLGQSYMEQDDYVAASQVFERYWIQYPTGRWKSEALHWLAVSFQAQDKHANAIRTCRRWLQNFPSADHQTRPAILMILAQELSKNGEREEAAKVYAEAERAGALTKPSELIRYADLLVREERYDEAVTRYRLALGAELDAAQVEWVQFQMARVRRAQGHYANAKTLLQELANLSQDNFIDRMALSMQTEMPDGLAMPFPAPMGGS